MYFVYTALNYLHEKGIIVRDLRINNILCTKPNSIRDIKICNVGLSKIIKDGNIPNSVLKDSVIFHDFTEHVDIPKNKQLTTIRTNTKQTQNIILAINLDTQKTNLKIKKKNTHANK